MSHTTITLDAETAVDTLEDIQRRLEKRRLEGLQNTCKLEVTGIRVLDRPLFD